MAFIPINKLPPSIQTLVSQRQLHRHQGNFSAADDFRKQLSALGFTLQDQPDGTVLVSHEAASSPAASTTLTLFGSGEISSVGRQIHDAALKLLGKNSVNIALISTPAGFQPNVTTVYGEIAAFFKQSLANYHPQVKIIYANHHTDANNPAIIEPLSTADYIFTGPGSPTYAVKHLQSTLLLESLINRVKQGSASLCLASAATIAFSHFALPVYEIYKVGESLHWQTGLNSLAALYRPLTIIPHLNNTEGGTKTDTSYCFMGKQRFKKLQALLPATETLWGLDELTGVVINLSSQQTQILGKGTLHYLTP